MSSFFIFVETPCIPGLKQLQQQNYSQTQHTAEYNMAV